MLGTIPSRTAEAVCLMRAYEHAKPAAKRVLDDPYARWFLRPLARAAMTARGVSGDLGRYADWVTDGLIRFVVARHRYIDDALARALRGRVEQVVLLGAGYDMRAYRFARALRGRPLYEVDHPATAARKARILARHAGELPATNAKRVTVDFQTQSFGDELNKAGFRKGALTFFVWEGVSMYLTRNAVKTTLETLRTIGGPGSSLVMDLWYLPDEPDIVSTARRMSPNLLALLGEPVTFGLHPEDAAGFFARQGFRTREIADTTVLAERYFPPNVYIYPTNYLVHAVARPPGTGRRGQPPAA